MSTKTALLRKRIIPQRILSSIPVSKMNEDLERYRTMAIEMGAVDAVIIPSHEIIIDERVRAKCIYPKCFHYGSNINCPPYAPDLDFMRRVINNYRYAILFSVKDETGDFLGAGFRKRLGRENPTKVVLNTVCSEIESRAFYEGYHLSLAFGQGPCKSFWCPDQPCSALQPDTGCRFSLKARSSMEGVGIDVFTMAAKKGWDVYPCGERVDINQVPHVLLVGLILII